MNHDRLPNFSPMPSILQRSSCSGEWSLSVAHRHAGEMPITHGMMISGRHSIGVLVSRPDSANVVTESVLIGDHDVA